ncbi:hypothetical protein [Chitinophaga sp. CF418]|uniref:hypothetical protein n=1 Tax=Chitinophaga sp. CF418 TaxID=1855287 RepID=UPI000921C59C|nr:hypothetical protein [Chitinophaga sp. CF418]SHN45558.1 hypothetical protein SAMN05216311_120107 [Chitinophaga sp. CF418]
MKRDLLRILFISAISGIVITVGVYFFLKPAFIASLNLTEKDKVGTAISGLTAPVIGLISTVLLYLALSKQTESNNEQMLKNESDIIFLLINQLESEINSFTFSINRTSNGVRAKESDTGFVGLHNFCLSCNSDTGWGEPLSAGERRFDHIFEAMQLMLIIESYLIVENRINVANLKVDIKQLINSKLRLYYDLKLRDGMVVLVKAFKRYQIDEQEIPKRVIEFVQTR